MTHSNHRQGTYDNLGNDFVALVWTDDIEASTAMRQRWADICLSHDPVHSSPRRWQHYVFDDKEKVTNLLKNLATAELGLSITITGLFDQVWDCCRTANIAPHTINQSLGIWGRTEKLPHRRILEFTTMCGHEKVSPNLVWHLAEAVQKGSLSIEEAASEMSRPCLCDIFNKIRAAALLRKLVADLKAGKISKPQSSPKKQVKAKTWGMDVDEEKCIGCLDCIPYCPMSAIVEISEKRVVAIDPEECVECGTCFRMDICPTGAIVPGDLKWPQILRPRISDPYASAESPTQTYPEQDKFTNRHLLLSRSANGIKFGFRLGRGHEMKTNDVNGRYAPGRVGIIAEMGRPVLGAHFSDVTKMTEALTSLGISHMNLPQINILMANKSRGKLRHDILDEKVNRCSVEVNVPLEQTSLVLRKLREVAGELDTVFAIDLISLVEKDGSIPDITAVKEAGMKVSINGKTNVGLGRPLAKFP